MQGFAPARRGPFVSAKGPKTIFFPGAALRVPSPYRIRWRGNSPCSNSLRQGMNSVLRLRRPQHGQSLMIWHPLWQSPLTTHVSRVRREISSISWTYESSIPRLASMRYGLLCVASDAWASVIWHQEHRSTSSASGSPQELQEHSLAIAEPSREC